MRKIFYLLIPVLACFVQMSQAQVVTTSPDPLQENSQDVIIYFHADQGNKGLMGASSSEAIYAHTGVDVVDGAGNRSTWKYAPTWGENLEKYQLSYVSENLWKLYIGNIREYYGVQPDETVERLCFVFRNANCTREGKGINNTDIFVDVVPEGFQLTFRKNMENDIIDASSASVTFTANTTSPAYISISVDGTIVAAQNNVKELTTTHTFTSPGEHNVKCIATSGAGTQESVINLLYIKPAQPAADQTIPPMGVTDNHDGTYTFCIAAPQKNSSVLVGSWNNYRPSSAGVMEYVDRMIDGVPFRYFKVTLPSTVAVAPFAYYYVIDASTSIGDPYARLILDSEFDRYIPQDVYPNLPAFPDNITTTKTMGYYADNLLDYEWQYDFCAPDKDNLIIYELLLRDFTGTEGAAYGNGTVRQAIAKIPYLKELGINAVELLPINEFNGNNSWGYNPNYYFAIDKAYGTPQDYKEFIDICHQNGIAVILDVVFNQADWQHPWYRMYPVGSNPFFNADAPHAFSVLNDWNQGYPLVEEQWKDCLKFWLSEYHVDGFRFDLVKGLGNNDSYADSGIAATDAYNPSRIARMKRLHAAMREVNPWAYFINENLAQAREENEMATDGELNWANYNNAGCQFAMGYSSDSNLNGCNAAKGGRTPGSTVSYLESHDEQRMAYKQTQWGYGNILTDHATACQRLGSAAAQLLLVPGSHMLWQFQELGNAQNAKSDNDENDTSPKIVNWNLLNNPDNKGLHDSYTELINVRINNSDLFPAGDSFANNCSAWTPGRSIVTVAGDREIYCAINPSPTDPLTMTINFASDYDSYYWILSKSYGSNPSFSAQAKTVTLQPGCYALITTRNVTGIENMVLDSNSRLNIFSGRGSIRLSGVENRVNIYNLDGILMDTCTEDTTVSLPAGVYVVRSGARSVKVLVM